MTVIARKWTIAHGLVKPAEWDDTAEVRPYMVISGPPTEPVQVVEAATYEGAVEALREMVEAVGEDITAGYDESDRAFDARARALSVLRTHRGQ